MTDMYNDIGRLFLCHHDIRYSNFLSALPEDQGGLPSLPSPFTGRTYSWRVVDFDLMKKTPLPKVAFRPIISLTSIVFYTMFRTGTL